MSNTLEPLNGQWKSDWGPVEIKVDGDAVSGTWAEGSLTGKAEGDKLAVDWVHKASGTTGKALLAVGKDGAELAGTWGFDDADKGEGDWTLEQTKRVEIKKPKADKADDKAGKAKPKPKAKPKAKPSEDNKD